MQISKNRRLRHHMKPLTFLKSLLFIDTRHSFLHIVTSLNINKYINIHTYFLLYIQVFIILSYVIKLFLQLCQFFLEKRGTGGGKGLIRNMHVCISIKITLYGTYIPKYMNSIHTRTCVHDYLFKRSRWLWPILDCINFHKLKDLYIKI